jgi:rhodanese-related sulfurtransferase
MPNVTRRIVLAGAAAAASFAILPPARAGHSVMSAGAARDAAASGELVLIDIRTPEEWAASGVPDVAVPIDMRSPEFLPRIAALKQERPERMIGLICATGGRSGYVAQYLHDAGVDGIVNVAAGVHGRPDGWLALGLPVKRPK